MKSMMENVLKLMGVSPLVSAQTFNKNTLFCRGGNLVLTFLNASYVGTVALGSSAQMNGADVLAVS